MTAPFLTALRRIATPNGDVMHCMKASDPGFVRFGEAYFSCIHPGAVKGWKRHHRMTLNLVCAVGAVRVVVYNPQGDIPPITDVVLSPDNPEQYQRLTIPASFWVGFSGISPNTAMLINLADLEHDPAEAENASLSAFPWPV